jgi:hypothetical protein
MNLTLQVKELEVKNFSLENELQELNEVFTLLK